MAVVEKIIHRIDDEPRAAKVSTLWRMLSSIRILVTNKIS